MRSFSSGSFGSGEDPWFRVGDVKVTTTVAVTAISAFSILVYVAEGNGRPLSKYFWLTPAGSGEAFGPSVSEGGIWRLVTWPLFHEPTRVLSAVILTVIFYMLGSQVEATMGRIRYTRFLGLLVLVPAVAVTVIDVALGIQGLAGGLRFPELAVLVAFALLYPDARFFFGIPAWVIAAGVVVIEALQTVADRNWFGLLLGTFVVGLALLLVRAMGFAEEADWIPRMPLPAMLGGPAGPSQTRSKARRKRSSNLRAVANDPIQDNLADMEVDALLDQVAREGIDSLSKAQRKKLEEHSKRLRKRDD